MVTSKNMNKTLAALAATVILAAGGHAQSTIPTNVGGVITISNTFSNPGDQWQGSLNGSYTNTGETYTIPSYYGSTYGTLPTGVPLLEFTDGMGSKITFWNDNGTWKPALWWRIEPSVATGTEEVGRAYFDTSGGVWQGITNVAGNFAVAWDGGGMGPGYVAPTQETPQGSSLSTSNQVGEVTQNLSFENGSWVPGGGQQ